MLRGICGILSVALILLAGAVVALAGQPCKLTFSVPDTHTKALAEGIAGFRQENPKLVQDVRITVYSEQELLDKRNEQDLVNQDVIFLYHKNYQTMQEIEPQIRAAKQNGARVIGIGGADIFASQGFYNVSFDEHPDIEAYWEYNGVENMKRLIGYLLNRFGGLSQAKIMDPVAQPAEGIFHPDAPDSRVLATLTGYKAWYASSGHQKQGPWVGIVSYNLIKTGDSKIQEALIRKLEEDGLNVICAIGYPADMLMEKYLMTDKPEVQLIVSLMFSHPKEKSQDLLKQMNVPVIRAVTLYSDLAKWAEAERIGMKRQASR
jgi:cobalamin biosynthesis Mg chelatase CobN